MQLKKIMLFLGIFCCFTLIATAGMISVRTVTIESKELSNFEINEIEKGLFEVRYISDDVQKGFITKNDFYHPCVESKGVNFCKPFAVKSIEEKIREKEKNIEQESNNFTQTITSNDLFKSKR